MKHSKFTLIELLVVVAIIGILASLLLPVLGKARRTAKAQVCSSQMKQIYLASSMWSDDNDNDHVYTKNGGSTWISYIMKYTGYSSLDDTHVFLCPEVSLGNTSYNWQKTKYGMSFYAGNTSRDDGDGLYQQVKSANISQPVNALMIMESSTFHYKGTIFGDDPSTWGRHDNKANTLFVDGHAKQNVRSNLQILDPNDTSYWAQWSYNTGK